MLSAIIRYAGCPEFPFTAKRGECVDNIPGKVHYCTKRVGIASVARIRVVRSGGACPGKVENGERENEKEVMKLQEALPLFPAVVCKV